ncbi:P-loop NTPase family protein [Cytobacillus massiliigabonensis]|uniref:DNA replication protein n=1 Tax=Cytobacillus massiliigabonensis TaxID=1871011 RepID=UPI000C847BC9|nr:DNA replication protein [Cytobacillus massiliigabonensis]
MNHASKCILSTQCKLANSESCNAHCPHFIALHGLNGVSGRVATAGTPRDYRLVTASNSPARAEQASVYRAVDAYIKTFERQFDAEGERIKSLYLFSESPGTGKTTTASVLLNEWLIAHYIGSLRLGLQPLQQPAYFLDVNNWQTLYNEFNRNNIPREIAETASREYYKQMKYAKTAPFVVFDDLGIRDASQPFKADLHSVINHRVTNKMPSVYTSNLPITEMEFVFDKRLYDRVRDFCLVILFDGESNRGMRR